MRRNQKLHQKLRIVLSAANQQQNPAKVVASSKLFAPPSRPSQHDVTLAVVP
jgi:hypothetical protein